MPPQSAQEMIDDRRVLLFDGTVDATALVARCERVLRET